MYFETHSVHLDRQGRISLPSGLFKSGGIERGGILCVYPMDGYWIACDPGRLKMVLETEFQGTSLNPDVRDIRRDFMLAVRSLHIDLQGRIHLQSLEPVQNSGEYRVIGMGFDFEIWPLSAWQERYSKTEENDGRHNGETRGKR